MPNISCPLPEKSTGICGWTWLEPWIKQFFDFLTKQFAAVKIITILPSTNALLRLSSVGKKKTTSWSHRMYKMPRTLLLWVSLLHIILKCEIALKLKLRVNSFDPSLYVSIHRFYCLALIGNFFPTFKVQVHSFFFSKTCLLWQTWRYLVLQYDPADSNHWPEPRLTRALANSNHFLFLLGVRVCGVLL